jgi:hypothetical protein
MTDENIILVEMDIPDQSADQVREMLGGTRPVPTFHIKRIIRSYLSSRRAQEDMELLQEANPACRYEVRPTQHIDA